MGRINSEQLFPHASSISRATSSPHFLHFPLSIMPFSSSCMVKSTIVVSKQLLQNTLLINLCWNSFVISLHFRAALKSVTDISITPLLISSSVMNTVPINNIEGLYNLQIDHAFFVW